MQLKRGVALRSSLYIRARLVRPLPLLKSHLEGMQCLRNVSRGTMLKYTLAEPDGTHAALFEFGPDSICLSSFLERPSVARYNSDLVRLLCILAYVDGFYTVSLRDIYPYVIEALRLTPANENVAAHDYTGAQIASLNSMNVTLSNRLLTLYRENAALSDTIKSHKAASVNAIMELRRRFGDGAAQIISSLYCDQGISIEEAVR